MIKRIKNATKEDLEFIQSQKAKELRAHHEHFHIAGNIEMFKIIFDKFNHPDRIWSMYPTIVELARNKNYLFLKYVFKSDLIVGRLVSREIISEDILMNCLPESANLIRLYNKQVTNGAIINRSKITLSEEFIMEVIEKGELNPEVDLVLLSFPIECFNKYADSIDYLKQMIENTTYVIHSLHSDFLPYLEIIKPGLSSQMVVEDRGIPEVPIIEVWQMEALNVDLSSIGGFQLRFQVAQPMPQEIYDSLKSLGNLSCIWNPYYLTQYPEIVESKWLNADFDYFDQAESLDSSIAYFRDYRLTGEKRFDALKKMSVQFADLKQIMDELTEEEELFLAENCKEYKKFIFAYLHYPYISHAVSAAPFSRNTEILESNFRHADLRKMGNSLKYVQFTKDQMWEICEQCPQIYEEDRVLEVRHQSAKSARF